jgi:hypothetical protein
MTVFCWKKTSKLTMLCEISSSHGGEYDVQSCPLKRRSTIILHGSKYIPEENSEHHYNVILTNFTIQNVDANVTVETPSNFALSLKYVLFWDHFKHLALFMHKLTCPSLQFVACNISLNFASVWHDHKPKKWWWRYSGFWHRVVPYVDANVSIFRAYAPFQT